jgi:tRNA G37 N-methylase Trm5
LSGKAKVVKGLTSAGLFAGKSLSTRGELDSADMCFAVRRRAEEANVNKTNLRQQKFLRLLLEEVSSRPLIHFHFIYERAERGNLLPARAPESCCVGFEILNARQEFLLS